jgi:tetratricopeptide (TPR) repeat protein
MVRGQTADTIAACECAAGHARRANAIEVENECEVLLAAAKLDGPTPVTNAIAYTARRLRDFSKHPRVGGELRKVLGLLYAKRGEIEKGRDLVRAARELDRETGLADAGAVARAAESRVEWYAGELDRATELARVALADLEEVEDRESAGRIAMYLTRYLEEAGKLDQAEAVLRRARQLTNAAEVSVVLELDAIERSCLRREDCSQMQNSSHAALTSQPVRRISISRTSSRPHRWRRSSSLRGGPQKRRKSSRTP